ncbi:quaternary ammonium compound-resistance protein SugE [Streptoalloteichus tenebrarius]|uniref:Quaternary ammonium compound-resistance protein SugE n=1 Tax=Streptoalloteichus tenebrarius (strain ATCC 17920 / DSM 40477 / JCM 4838 / CBS 697.72 / NBRC 16177 / NCIMB 11028 / NRRL B-12390 / A12253. 1 / ISP 5477) TaxID=1933 RepID=A0ABT1I2U3_STRSD|nr:multidrug efflux SMR transporter [Streptoalloteichus tenebrarius]MCP2262109.1 quaternary ammonium compound-resistance protein SugE [Streptoalloteichus tenebrarius]
MAWVVLLLSGVFEAVWAIALKLSDGFTRVGWVITFVVAAAISLAGLTWALKTLPVGPAYAVWTGTGAALAAVVGMVWLGDGVSTLKIVSLLLIVAGIIGLNLAGATH